MDTESCKDFLRGQILSAFKVAFSNMSQKSAILITDDKTTKILDTCLKVHQLNDLGIGALVNVKYARERVNISPIYFLSSSLRSIKSVIKDYENSKQTQYAGIAHLLICSSITADCLELLKTSNLRKHLKTFQEVYCDYHALESRVFHFDRPEAFRSLYMNLDRQRELLETSENLFNLCVSLEEHPYIRHPRDSELVHDLAQIFESYFSKKMSEMPGFKPRKKRATLIILDRSQDTVAPLLHEITYQAMIKDLIPGESKYLPLEKSDNDSVADVSTRFYYDTDPMWADFRHKNLPHVLQDLQTKFTEFKKTNRIAQQQVNEEEHKDNLLKSVRDIPKYKKMTKSFNSHFEIKDKLVNLYKLLDLKKVADIEQSLVTGIGEGGRSIKLSEVQTGLTSLLKDPTVAKEIKLRLLLVYIISQGGLSEQQRLVLFTAANLSVRDSDAIYNIRAFGVTIKSEGKNSKKPLFYKDTQASAKELSKSEFAQSRYEPLIATIVKKLDKGNLSEANFPFCGPAEDGKAISGTFGGRSLRKRQKSSKVSNKSRLIIFVLGGVCYSEIRECYLLAEKLGREIYIGSSHVMTPKGYIDLLRGPEVEAVVDGKEAIVDVVELKGR